MKDYECLMVDFLAERGIQFKVEFVKNDLYFKDDKQVRDIYKFTLTRGDRRYSSKFGQSIMNSQYYQDRHIDIRTYCLDGSCRTGGFKLNDIDKYKEYIRLVKGKVPSAYDVISCLTYYDPGSFEDFCSEYGYETDSITAKKIYKKVKKEWAGVQSLFSDDDINYLREII